MGQVKRQGHTSVNVNALSFNSNRSDFDWNRGATKVVIL